jgi:hypothetical protein
MAQIAVKADSGETITTKPPTYSLSYIVMDRVDGAQAGD